MRKLTKSILRFIPILFILTLVLTLIIGCGQPKEQPRLIKPSEVEKMAKKALFIIAQKDFQDQEYAVPKEILEKGGIEVVTAAKNKGVCQGKFGSVVQATVALGEAKVKDYEAIVFIGGPGAVVYQQDNRAHGIAQEAVKEDKILAGICIAPTILAYAGVLEGKEATVWNGDGEQQEVLEGEGATFRDEEVVSDGKIITANGPGAAERFGKTILAALKKP